MVHPASDYSMFGTVESMQKSFTGEGGSGRAIDRSKISLTNNLDSRDFV